MDVEQVGHPQVLRPRHALDGPDDRRGLRAAQQVAQRQSARHGIGIGVVVEQNQHALGVGEVPLVLLDACPRQRPSELGQQRAAEQLRHREIRDVGKSGPDLFLALRRGARADAQHVNQRTARVADVVQHALETALAAVLDDDAGAGGDVGLVERVLPLQVAGGDVHARLGEPARKRRALD